MARAPFCVYVVPKKKGSDICEERCTSLAIALRVARNLKFVYGDSVWIARVAQPAHNDRSR